MMVQFGYVTLFVGAFPLAPLICLLNNIVEIRIDATNFVTSFRRPLPARVSGIRIWRRCLNIILKLSVLCNGAFLAFTSEFIPTMVYRYTVSNDYSTKGYMFWTMAKLNTTGWPEYLAFKPHDEFCYYRDFRDDDTNQKLVWWQIMVARLGFFVIFVIFFYFIQWLCDFLVPDVPQHVKVKVDRSNFLARQALYGQEISESNSAGSGPRPRDGFPRSPTLNTKRRPTESTVATTVPIFGDQTDQKPAANGHAKLATNHTVNVNVKAKSITPVLESNANGVLMNGNGHVIRESTGDDDEDEDEVPEPKWKLENETRQMHPNQLPTSPLYRNSMRRVQGTHDLARLKRHQTVTSNV